MCENCKNQSSDAFVRGIATTLWGEAWARHAEEHNCFNLSGCEITGVMPEIPEIAWRMAERLAGYIEGKTGASLCCIFAAAMQADGKAELTHEDYHGPDAERFGECLAFMAMGSGVSWFDDHKRFEFGGEPFKVPYSEENGELLYYADRTCEEETDFRPCPECGHYVELDEAACSECKTALEWNDDGSPAVAEKE